MHMESNYRFNWRMQPTIQPNNSNRMVAGQWRDGGGNVAGERASVRASICEGEQPGERATVRASINENEQPGVRATGGPSNREGEQPGDRATGRVSDQESKRQ